MNKFLKNILFISLSFLLLISVLIFSVLWAYSNSIPDYKFLKNYKPPVSSKVYSGEGELVADFSKEKRIFVPYSSIPKNVINSFLSANYLMLFSSEMKAPNGPNYSRYSSPIFDSLYRTIQYLPAGEERTNWNAEIF